MKKLLLGILLLGCLAISVSAQNTKLQGFCEDGGKTVTTQGLVSTTKVQQSFPSCTVTVFDVGTSTPSTIFSNATGTSKANPFTAASDGIWFFYATPGTRYDVRFSAGGIVTPFTLGDLIAPLTTAGGGGSVTSVAVSGGTTGLTTSGGPITTSGTITIAGTLVAANGGTGVATLTGLAKGNGTSSFTAAVAGTDYVAPGSITSNGITMSTARLLGRSTAATGSVEEITVGSGLSLSGGSLTATGGGGSVTSINVSGGSTGLTFSGGPITTSGTITEAGTLGSTNGGTGVNNGSSTITLGGNLTLSGAFTTTLTVTANTSVTLPTSGTLVNTAVTALSSLASIGTITSGVWNGTIIVPTYGGTGLSSLTPYAVITGGTTSTGNFQQVSGVGTSGQVLTSAGAGALPTWTTIAGSGTVTNSGTLTSGKAIIGNGGVDVKATKLTITDPATTATLTLANSSTFTTIGAFITILTSTADTTVTLPTTGTLVNSAVTTLSSLASIGTITTGTWQGTAIAFANGGTGLTAAADDTVMVSSGSAWVAKAVPNCTDSGGNHLNYTASTNSFSCGTTGGATITIGTTAIASGTATRLLYETPGNVAGEISNATSDGTTLTMTSPVAVTAITTSSSTFALLNTTATTINAFGAATTLNIGASATTILNFGGSTTAAEFRFLEPSGSGTNYSAFKVVAQGANITYSLPPTVGASGTVLTDAAGNGVLTWAAGGTGSGGTLAVFTAQSNQPPATNFATLDTRNSESLLAYDDTTNWDAVFVGNVGSRYTATGINVTIEWAAASATSGNVVWNAQFERQQDGTDTIASDSFATAQTTTCAAPSTSGIVQYCTITFSNSQIDGLLVNEAFRLKVTRNAASGSDTMTGNAQVVRVWMKEP